MDTMIATIESIPELEARTNMMLATISSIPARIAGMRQPCSDWVMR